MPSLLTLFFYAVVGGFGWSLGVYMFNILCIALTPRRK